MSLGRAYEIGFLLATTMGLLAVLLGGELPAYAWLSLLAGPTSTLLRTKNINVPSVVGTSLGGLGLLGGAWAIVELGIEALVLAGTMLLLTLLCGRLLTRVSLRHDLQALLLSLLLVFAGSVLHTQMTYAAVLIGFAITGVWALVSRQLVAGASQEAQRAGGAPLHHTLARRDIITPAFLGVTAGLVVSLLLATLAVFVAFPRIGMGQFGFALGNRLHLAGDVSLVGRSRGNFGGGTVVARVTGLDIGQFVRGLYLRGPVFDEVRSDGFGRSAPQTHWRPVETQLAGGSRQQNYQVYMQPLGGQTLLALGPVDHARIIAGGNSNPSIPNRIETLRFHPELRASQTLAGPVRFEVTGNLSFADKGWLAQPTQKVPDTDDALRRLDEKALRRYLVLPEQLDPRVRSLARELTVGKEFSSEKADILREFLMRDFTYTLEQLNKDKPDPLAGFLFEDRRGHCEYFATAFAVLLRSSGVPARVVGGLQGGYWDDATDTAIFTTSHAHAWVEWYARDHGWVLDDATPAVGGQELGSLAKLLERLERSWDDYVIDFGFATQLDLARRAASAMTGSRSFNIRRIGWGELLGSVGVGVALLGLMWILRRVVRRHTKGDPLAMALQAAIERIRGEALPTSWTLREGVESLPTANPALHVGLGLYEQHCFGNRPLPRHRLEVAIRELRRAGNGHS
ncbi:MAG: hypothetical protein A2289_04970 [Deltaproteobacteria bacterium RIFOXYA12_FULL_58_15]|nr:MAG: hypothetical protein A2289_04970 [Deltaproteobacteria bacterium RIFOXYA12_FULL_58_15]